MLGHSSPKVMLDVYAHLFADDLDVLASRLHDAKIKSDADQVRTSGRVTALPSITRDGRHAVWPAVERGAALGSRTPDLRITSASL
jgi:hypothetical protein